MDETDLFKLSPEDIENLRKESGVLTAGRFAACPCGKLLDASRYQRKLHSGYHTQRGEPGLGIGINYTDLLCEECRSNFQGWPRIVCLACKRLMGFVSSGKDKGGFEFKMGRHYHIKQCPQCVPGLVTVPILEYLAYNDEQQKRRIVNHDLLEEIEKKRLQGQRDAAILREELKANGFGQED